MAKKYKNGIPTKGIYSSFRASHQPFRVVAMYRDIAMALTRLVHNIQWGVNQFRSYQYLYTYTDSLPTTAWSRMMCSAWSTTRTDAHRFGLLEHFSNRPQISENPPNSGTSPSSQEINGNGLVYSFRYARLTRYGGTAKAAKAVRSVVCRLDMYVAARQRDAPRSNGYFMSCGS